MIYNCIKTPTFSEWLYFLGMEKCFVGSEIGRHELEGLCGNPCQKTAHVPFPPSGCLSYLRETYSYDDKNDSNPGCSELILKELQDALVHISAPLDGFDDAAKIVIHQYEVRRFFSNICATHALK